jgi:hypothetical protein
MMWRLGTRSTYTVPSFGAAQVPGVDAGVWLTEIERWRLAGTYTAVHQLVGPWYRRECSVCGTRGRCAYARWADGVLTEKARRDWYGR